MKLESFRGASVPHALAAARLALGDDVMVVRTHVRREEGVAVAEVVVTTAQALEQFRERIEPGPLPLLGAGGRTRPFTVALVGPTGAGKTTTLVKLACHPRAFGGRRVGVLTLDTYRVGALEQLGTFAEVAALPMEVVYQPAEVPEAARRLAGCDVILVDTPGRSPRSPEADTEWRAALEALRPDELHLVLPAALRLDVAEAVGRAYRQLGATHLLLSKLDEVPGETGVADLAVALDLPTRWVTDGQEVPADLRPAAPRILSSLGLSAAGAERNAA